MTNDLSPTRHIAVLRASMDRLRASADGLRDIVGATQQTIDRSKELLARLDNPERGRQSWRYDPIRLTETLRRWAADGPDDLRQEIEAIATDLERDGRS